MKVKIVDVSPENATYYRKNEVIGTIGKFVPDVSEWSMPGYQAGNFFVDGSHDMFYRAIKVEPVKPKHRVKKLKREIKLLRAEKDALVEANLSLQKENLSLRSQLSDQHMGEMQI